MATTNEEELKIPDEKKSGEPASDEDGGRPASYNQEQYYMSGPKLGIIIASLCLALFLLGLDTAIVATAIPKTTERFNSTKDIGWYGSAYFLALCSVLPIGGKIYSEFSLKWTFLGFFSVFELGSLLCAVATSSKMLIVGRAVAGAGGSGIVSGIMTIIAHVIPLSQRAGYMAIGGATMGISTISGPLIGGALTQKASWRWCFYINLPIGAVTAIVLVALFHPPIRPNEERPVIERAKRLDPIGAFLLTPAIIMVLLALQWGGNEHPWKSATIIGLFCGFGILFLVFIGWQLHKGSGAMVPLRLLARRTIVSTSLRSTCVFGSLFIVIYYIPEWFQVIKSASPVKSGVMNLALFVPQIIGSIIAGTMITKLGYCNPWIIAGTVLSAIATGLYSTLKVDSGHALWIGFQVLNGVGAGFSMETPLTLAQTALSGEEAAVGISLVTFFQFFGSSIFLAIAETVFSNTLTSELTKHVPEVNPTTLMHIGTSAVRNFVTPEQLPAVLAAYDKAITSTFYVAASASACSFFAASFAEWNSVKAGKQAAQDESQTEK
ncbi:MFS general substrate transporter [Rhizodiscina lignyota]|uniref:MFS general substrate transporter n=1 Tax=Rhizodiscina lignyota TaxID=1504668 RepID=A0A9P4IQM4_9PEZI|nr:MFS general substrate transporter [Rhizodiscina lignyota]